MVQNDPLTLIAEQTQEIFSQAIQPGRFLVDVFPWLRFIPEWFPGTGWKKTVREWRQLSDRMLNAGYEWTLKQIVRIFGDTVLVFTFFSRQEQDKAIPSFLSEHMQRLDPEDTEGKEMLKRVASSLYGGGTDTTVSATSSFFLLMSLHPEVQRKAQEEIDRVVGYDRLPNAQDRNNLPYVDAIMREVMRLNPVAPLGKSQCDVPLELLTCAPGLPHRLKEDDVYEGMYP